MLGRDVILAYLRAADIDHLFGVPGTNEIPLIDTTSEPGAGVAYIPCLHENIAMGAAMGYAWATGRPGAVELHLTPGAGHGIGNLYNAAKSHVPLLVLCAQQHSELLLQEPVLASDTVRTAGQYAKWAYEVRTPVELPQVMQRALKEATTPPFKPVFLSIPWDFTLAEVPDAPALVTSVGRQFSGDPAAIAAAAGILAGAERPVIVAGDGVGQAEAWDGIRALAELIGAPVYDEPMSSYMNYPNHLYQWQGEIPQTQSGQQEVFGQHDVAFLCGFNAQAHVFVFDYADGPLIPPGVRQVHLHDDAWEIAKNGFAEAAVFGAIAPTLTLLCEAVAQHPSRDPVAADARNAELVGLDEDRRGRLGGHRESLAARDPGSLPVGDDVAIALGDLQAEMRVPMMLVDEAISDQDSFHQYCHFDAPNSYFNAQGGALGMSMPASIGARLGSGGARTIVNTVGDGTALFYPHTWWTVRKFGLPVLYVITNNREYRTLQLGEQALESVVGFKPSGPAWYLELTDPPVSFVAIAAAFGIQGTLVSSLGELEGGLRTGLEAVQGGQPYVVEVLMDRNPPAGDAVPRRDVVAEQAGAPQVRRLGAP